MTVVLAKRLDITLDAYYRVAWQGEDVTIAEQALAIIAAARASFLALLDANPKMRIYGVTTAHHTGATTLLSQEERQAYASHLPRSGFSFGEPLPERVVRGMVLARLANFLEGHAAADISLCAVTDNPVYVPPDDSRSLGTVMSTGGFHNAMASPTIDSINFAFADLCQLAEHETERLVESGSELALAEQEPSIVMLYMVQAGWAEEARMAAQPTLLPLGGVGPTDTPTPTFFAWRKAQEVGSCLDAALAVLAVVSSFTLHVGERRASPGLAPILEEIHCHFPPEAARGPIGQNLQALSAAFSRRVFEGNSG